jgi:MFS superfamily sulfate permease-like transporter
METPVKFTAPMLTLPAALDVGKHEFSALNKVEIGFTLIMIVLTVCGRLRLKIILFLFLITVIVFSQAVWLIPALSQRADIIIAGEIPAKSNIHIYYIIVEVLKIVLLLFLGGFQVKNLRGNYFLNL